MSNILGSAVAKKYPEKGFIVTGPNWWDVRVLEDDGTGNAKDAEVQLTKEECEQAVVEYLEYMKTDEYKELANKMQKDPQLTEENE